MNDITIDEFGQHGADHAGRVHLQLLKIQNIISSKQYNFNLNTNKNET
jgi:hypothetical protein